MIRWLTLAALVTACGVPEHETTTLPPLAPVTSTSSTTTTTTTTRPELSTIARPATVFRPAVRVDPPTPPTTPDGPASARCPEWWSEARDVGWPERELSELDWIIWCESRCTPTAHNRSGASGLAQVMPGWWHGRDPYDPVVNLTMALEVHAEQGWRAWSCS